MRPVILSQTGVGISSPSPMDYRQGNFKIGFGVVVSGTVNYTVQHSFDDPEATYATDYNTDATWFDHAAVAALAVNADGNYAFNIRSVRIEVNSGTGTATATFLQGL